MGLTRTYDSDLSLSLFVALETTQGQMINEMEYQAQNAPQAHFIEGRAYGAIS